MILNNHRKEMLCRAYVHAIAAVAGVASSRPDPDYGVDLSLRSIEKIGSRHIDTGLQIDLQLKTTTQAIVKDDEILFDLDVRAYDILRDPTAFCPRFLVLFVLPGDEKEWLQQSVDELTLRRCAYWLSLKGMLECDSTTTIRVALSASNIFSVDFVRSSFGRD